MQVRKILRKPINLVTFAALSGILLVLSTLPSVVPVAHAYGRAQWELGFSFSCNDPAVCGPAPPGTTAPGTSGFWGWCAFGGSGTWGDCQVTGYGRTSLGVAISPSHQAVDITGWTTVLSSLGPGAPPMPFFNLLSGSFTSTGPGTPFPLTFPSGPVFPAVPGHFSMSLSPGIRGMIQVNQIPA